MFQEIGFFNAAFRTAGRRKVAIRHGEGSEEKILAGDTIQAIDSKRTDTCDPLSASRIFTGIPLDAVTVTVIRDGTLKTLHLFPRKEPLVEFAPRYHSTTFCRAQRAALRLN